MTVNQRTATLLVLLLALHSANGSSLSTGSGPSEPLATSTLGSLVDEPLGVEGENRQGGTTVKKELPTTTTTSEPAPPEAPPTQPPTGQQQSPLAAMLPEGLMQRQQDLVGLSPELSKGISETLAQLPANAYNRQEQNTTTNESIEGLLPKGTSLFQKDSIDSTALSQMDCHLRNIDYCVAGLLGTAQKMLPENDAEFETRCDEMKATTSCLAIYNKRCQTVKVFSLLAPFAQAPMQELRKPHLLTEAQAEVASGVAQAPLPGEIRAQLAPSSGRHSNSQQSISLGNLMELCERDAKGSSENGALRARLFELAKCINSRVPKLTPCIEDLKTAIQLYYEPERVLPMRPTCCALARFRACSSSAVDGVCGLSSFEQLVQSLGGTGGQSGGPLSMIRTIDRICRQATDHKSSYCREVLPPAGMRAPQRRGNKASKLAKALDLISFAPATQELGAL